MAESDHFFIICLRSFALTGQRASAPCVHDYVARCQTS